FFRSKNTHRFSPERVPFPVFDREKDLYNLGVELRAAVAADLLAGYGVGLGFAVRSVAGDTVKRVHDGEDAGANADLLALQPPRVTAAVIPLLMTEDQFDDGRRGLGAL